VTLRRQGEDRAEFIVSRVDAPGTAVASGQVLVVADATSPAIRSIEQRRAGLPAGRTPEEFYTGLRRAGLDYGPHFQGVTALWSRPGEALGHVRLRADRQALEAYQVHPALLDACFQVLAETMEPDGRDDTYLPLAVESVVLWRRPPLEVFAHVQTQKGLGEGTLAGDLEVCDGAGEPVASVRGLSLRRAGPDLLARLQQAIDVAPPATPHRPRAQSWSTSAPEHPLLGRPLPAVADQPDARYWQRELRLEEMPFASLMRRNGSVALTAASLAHIALAAAAEAVPGTPWQLVHVQSESAWVVSGAGSGAMQVQFAAQDGEATVRVFRTTDDAGANWALQARVRLKPGAAVETRP
jgi:polyketide synthase-like dehydratase family protein/polyketide synthase family protein